ncbi:hypothetical protein SAMN04244553_3443 [Nocardia amikacinitolerans]|uniref:Uncharacterized protein n=1 Tax=Nocardia amikacinitolerans TaxID=756689 RepID=A0A285LC44_9NOCA|nr:hypothetical protein SAMN04244553_3443 [Nocardia amikacinitolerans]
MCHLSMADWERRGHGAVEGAGLLRRGMMRRGVAAVVVFTTRALPGTGLGATYAHAGAA